MYIDEPLRPRFVVVRQRALLERLSRVLIARNWPLWTAGDRLADSLYPFGRIEPPVLQLDQPSDVLNDLSHFPEPPESDKLDKLLLGWKYAPPEYCRWNRRYH